MIYDCFIFFDELDLLEIRLNELNSVVDKFVLVEATKSFQKKPKPLYFKNNKARFQKFEDKIIHIIVDEYPNFFSRFRIPKPMDYENSQRNKVVIGLKDAKPDDVIIYSDLDEIPRAEKIMQYKNAPGIKVFQQQLYSYFFDCIMTYSNGESNKYEAGSIKYWNGPVMLNYSDFTSFKEIRKLRNCSSEECVLIENGGWHFTYFGGYKNIIKKIKSFSHLNEAKEHLGEGLNSTQYIKEMIAQGKDLYGRNISYQFITPREDLPKYLLNNMPKFSQHFFHKPEHD